MHRPLRLAAWTLGGLLSLTCFGALPGGQDVPRPVVSWPAGPLEVRVAYDRPLDPSVAQAVVGRSIACVEPSGAGGAAGEARPAATLGQLRIAAARLDDGGRTLVLATDPHPREATYLLPPPIAPSGPREDGELAYDLTGVEVTWSDGQEGAEPGWSGWWPMLQTDEARALTADSVAHQRCFALLDRPGRLSLRTFVLLPAGTTTVRLEASAPIEATLAYEAPGSTAEDKGRHRAEWVVDSTGEAVELAATIPTGAGGQAVTVRASCRTESDPSDRLLPRAWQILPWAPTATPLSAEVPPLPLRLEGGDRRRGEAIFTSDEAKCATCHKVRGQGTGDVGPDLGELVGRDPAEVYRDIAEPSAVIEPEYVPYSVALLDGRVAVGVVRADGADTIRVLDTDGKETRLSRSEVEELRASGTSIMPVGLAGALGEAQMRDLLTFLLTPPPGAEPADAPGATPTALARDPATPGTILGTAPAAALPKLAVAVAFPDVKFDRPVALAYPDDGSNLLFVVEQRGLIWSFPNDPSTADQEPFLDIRSRVLSPTTGGHNEEGLLGLAFHPKYQDNGQFFVYYSAREGATGRRSVVSRLQVSPSDPRKADRASEQRIWVSAPDPYGNHNGGCILFGPDGFLYITLGDSGAADDPLTTGQNPRDWFGSILRIDVDHPSGGRPYGIPADNPARRDPKFAHWAPEVYCIGLRNVWKFSFDRQTGTLWAGDVGQNLWEFVHIIENGGNYGWSLMEGFHSFRPRQRKDPASPLSRPLAEYPHNPNQAGSRRTDNGLSITGGYVYRGQALPKLVGIYVYGDYSTGRIWGLRAQGGRAVTNGELIDLRRGPGINIAAFGEDPAGELYILAFDGRIYHLVPR